LPPCSYWRCPKPIISAGKGKTFRSPNVNTHDKGRYHTLMQIDSALAHYGLLQIVFADAAEHVAQALFDLRVVNAPNLEFSKLFALELNQLLNQLRQELAQFQQYGPSTQEHMQIVDAAINRVDELRQWRNHRTHARVKVTSDGWGLFDKKTGKHLVINEVECEEKIKKAINAIVDLEAYIPHLQNALAFQKEAIKVEGCEC